MRRVFVVGFAFLVGGILLAGVTPAAAFLEFLFGSRPSYDVRPQPEAQPLDMRVSPKRRPRPKYENKHGKVRRETHKSAAVAHPVVRQVPMDPRKMPDWYLKDPNIRHGDIVFLSDGPKVYQGSGKIRVREDFVSLRDSRLLSASGARDIRMMAAGIWVPADSAAASLRAAAPRKGRRKRVR